MAMLYVSRKLNQEASRRLYRCLDGFYFTDDDCDACLNVVPDLAHGLCSGFSELSSSVEYSKECEDGEFDDYVMVARVEGICTLFRSRP